MQRIAALLLLVRQLRTRRAVVAGLAGSLLGVLGLHGAAARAFRRADARTREHDPRHVAELSDWWEYLANRADLRRGAPAHDEPLLAVRLRPARLRPARRSGGRGARLTRTGVHGLVAPAGLKVLVVGLGTPPGPLELTVDDVPIAKVDLARSGRRLPGMLGLHRGIFTVRRDALATFPPRAVLSVRSAGQVARGLEVMVPHGDGTLLARAEATFPSVDKKGWLLPSEDEVVAHQRSLARLCVDAATFLRDELGRDLFLIYGTLLGLVREGRFLPWDDDFDVAYLSEHTDVDAVRAESIDVMRALAAGGFTVGLNPRGRPFWLGGPDGLGRVRLDVRPVWEMDGAVWAAKHARLPLGREHFAPCRSVTVDGTTFAVPRDAEAFLAAYYGADWREPKPGHREPSLLTREQQAVFDRLRLTHPEVVAINAGTDGGAGRAAGGAAGGPVVHAYGTVPLYPLDVRARVMGV